MRKSNREVNGEKVFRYSIRKYHFGAASVAVAALMFFANGAVKADTLPVSPATANTEKVNAGVTDLTEGVPLEKSLETEGNKEIVAPESVEKTSNKEDGAGSNAQGEKEIKVSDKTVIPANQTEEINKVETNGKEKEVVTNKDKLESLLKEIDQLNLKDYTEDTVKVLQEKVAKAKEVLVNATTQKEIDLAYNALVGYKNAGLKRVPKPKGELTPKPDTTNGKVTVGIKAENTEPNGTNIAGHNHSMNRTSLPEGSGLRAVPEGDATFNLDSGTLETEVDGAPNAKFLVVWRKGQGYKPQLTSDGLGIRLLYDRQIPDSTFVRRLFNTTGNINTVGSYDVTFELKDGATGVLYAKKDFKVTVKPHAPKVTVENLENAAGTRAKVTATARNPQYSSGEQPGESSVDFYVNGVKKQTVTAINGVAEWTPTEVFNVNDRITATNTARDKQFLPSRGTNINVPITATTSNMSSEVVIPTPVAPTVNKDELQALVDEAPGIKTTAAYYNAPENNRNAYDEAITTGDTALKKQNVQQDELNTNRDKIKEAKKGLTGQATNTDALTRATGTDADSTKATDAKYYNADASKKDAYDQAVSNGKTVLGKANVTQKEVDGALSAINTAKGQLDGQATNTQELQALVDEAANTVLSYKYHNADKDKKDAFDKAIEKAKAVLDDVYASQKAVDEARDNLKLAKESLNGIYIPPYTPQADQPQPSTPTQPDQGATETPTVPSEPAPQPSQPTAPSQPASPAPAPSSAPTQAPKVAASTSASSTSTQAPAQEQVDKSELRALTQELDQRLKALATVSDPKIDAAKAVLLDAQKALEDSALTEQGLRTAVESVKAALDSLKDVKANASDSKPAQDKKDAKQGTEDSKDSDKMTETNSVPAGVIVVSLLALLGVIAFWLVRRKKESEIQQLSTELTKVLGQLDAEKADKKVLAKAQKLLQETLDFVKEENGSAETEAKLVEELKAILAKLK